MENRSWPLWNTGFYLKWAFNQWNLVPNFWSSLMKVRSRPWIEAGFYFYVLFYLVFYAGFFTKQTFIHGSAVPVSSYDSKSGFETHGQFSKPIGDMNFTRPIFEVGVYSMKYGTHFRPYPMKSRSRHLFDAGFYSRHPIVCHPMKNESRPLFDAGFYSIQAFIQGNTVPIINPYPMDNRSRPSYDAGFYSR